MHRKHTDANWLSLHGFCSFIRCCCSFRMQCCVSEMFSTVPNGLQESAESCVLWLKSINKDCYLSFTQSKKHAIWIIHDHDHHTSTSVISWTDEPHLFYYHYCLISSTRKDVTVLGLGAYIYKVFYLLHFFSYFIHLLWRILN